MLSQRRRRWVNIDPALAKCGDLEELPSVARLKVRDIPGPNV